MKKDAGHHNQRLSSPRQVRALRELLKGPRSVRELSDSTGANGVPQLISTLRAKGLYIDTIDRVGFDRDGRKVYFGVYYLEEESQALASELIEDYGLKRGAA